MVWFMRLNATVFTRWALLATWAAVIFVLSAQHSLTLAPDPALDWVLRKAAHVTFYAVFGALAYAALETSPLSRPGLGAFVIGALYALSDEVHQSFVAGRSPLVTDVGFDVVGVLIGILLVSWVLKRRT
jgi:VanZ family protein